MTITQAATQIMYRAGPRPRTTDMNPHTQLNQQPDLPLTRQLIARMAALDHIALGPSGRAPHGTVGFYIDQAQGSDDPDAFMLGREFAHVHPEPDSSLHLTLPEPVRSDAIAMGWAEPHPLAGLPTISRNIVLVYAPRDASELDQVAALARASHSYALGR